MIDTNRIKVLEDTLREAIDMLDWIGCSPEGYDELMRMVEEKRQKFLTVLEEYNDQTIKSSR